MCVKSSGSLITTDLFATIFFPLFLFFHPPLRPGSVTINNIYPPPPKKERVTNEKQARKEADRSRRLDTFCSSRIFLLFFFFFSFLRLENFSFDGRKISGLSFFSREAWFTIYFWDIGIFTIRKLELQSKDIDSLERPLSLKKSSLWIFSNPLIIKPEFRFLFFVQCNSPQISFAFFFLLFRYYTI